MLGVRRPGLPWSRALARAPRCGSLPASLLAPRHPSRVTDKKKSREKRNDRSPCCARAFFADERPRFRATCPPSATGRPMQAPSCARRASRSACRRQQCVTSVCFVQLRIASRCLRRGVSGPVLRGTGRSTRRCNALCLGGKIIGSAITWKSSGMDEHRLSGRRTRKVRKYAAGSTKSSRSPPSTSNR